MIRPNLLALFIHSPNNWYQTKIREKIHKNVSLKYFHSADLQLKSTRIKQHSINRAKKNLKQINQI